MAPSPGADLHRAYFDDSTLSDLTIRLADRTVHVHRIVLCRRSIYFEKLILGGFKVSKATVALHSCPNLPNSQESGLKEIELHDDDPDAMMALFRYIYDLPYNDLFEELDERSDTQTQLQFLAKVYLAADKYQVDGLPVNVTKLMETIAWSTEGNWEPDTIPKDSLAAAKIIFNGTASQDDACRVTMVNFFVTCIVDFRQMPEFSALLSECGDVGTAIIAHKNLSLMLQGYWDCEGEVHQSAVPRCPICDSVFPVNSVLQHRSNEYWICPRCGKRRKPVCSDRHQRRLECEWIQVDQH